MADIKNQRKLQRNISLLDIWVLAYIKALSTYSRFSCSNIPLQVRQPILPYSWSNWGGVSQCNENIEALLSVGSSHTSYCFPEGLKVGHHNGNMVGTACHSEKAQCHNITVAEP
jgi:hypothetical protein